MIFQQNLQSIILLQICYFVTKKAAHFVEDNEKIRRVMRIVIYCAVLLLVGVSVYQISYDVRTIGDEGSDLCHSWYFLTSAFFNQVANGFFIFIGCRVISMVRRYNKHQEALIGDPNHSSV